MFDGEILAVNGTIATTSEIIEFEDGLSYVVHYTGVDGSSYGPYAITEVPGQDKQFSCSDLANTYVRDSVLGYLIQTGSRYIISTVDELDVSKWSVIEKEPKGRNVQISAVNYDERVYDFDEEE